MESLLFRKKRTNMRSGFVRWVTIGLLTICSLVLTMIALPDFSTIESIAMRDSHSSMTDFYERAEAHSGVALLDTTVTVIAIDDCSHDDIAKALDLVSASKPKSIGLDVIFYSLDNDSLLRASLKNASSFLTLPINVGEPLPSQSFANNDSLPDARFARVDLAQEHRSVPIRHYYLNVDDNPSFTKQLALTAGYDIHNLNETESIRYGAREFRVVNAIEMLKEENIPAEEFKDKIVLFGTVNDYNDMHYTPIDEDMPGVMVHAYSLSTLISGDPVKSLPPVVVYAVALLFTVATIWLSMWVADRPYSNLVSRIIPIGIIIIFIYICYHCYKAYNLYIDFTIVLAMTASGMLCYDIYTGVPSLIKTLCRKLSKNNEKFT